MTSLLRIALPSAVAGALAVGAAFLAPTFFAGDAPHAQTAGSFTPAEREEIGTIVREYLLTNPELMREVFIELERRQVAEQEARQRQALEDSAAQLFDAEHDIVMGNPEGDVTLVEFFDYNCGFCKRALGDVMAMIEKDPNLRVVLKEFPVLGEDSTAAARVSVAATLQMTEEQAARYHTDLLNTRGRVGGETALALAEEMGLDMDRLAADIESQEVREVLMANMSLADDLGLTGTPAWVVGDGVIFGAVGEARLTEAVANARECGSVSC